MLGGDCSCIPDPDYCDTRVTCKEGEMFDIDECKCVADPDYCDVNQKCQGYEHFDIDLCKCVPNPTTIPTKPPCVKVACRNRYVWLEQECSCVCPPYICEIGKDKKNYQKTVNKPFYN
jgi:hypothetical protein